MFSELFAFTLPTLSDSPHTAPRFGGRLPRLQNFYKQRTVETLAGFPLLFIFQNTALHPVCVSTVRPMCPWCSEAQSPCIWLFMCVHFSVSPPLFTSMQREPFLPFGVCVCECVCVCGSLGCSASPRQRPEAHFPCACVFVSLCTCLPLSPGCPETRVNHPSLVLLRLS